MQRSNNMAVVALAAVAALIYYKRSIVYYGLISRKQLEETAARVVEVIGGGENAYRLLMETAAAETDLGNAKDRSWSVGVGVMQFDPIAFDDVQLRTPKQLKDLVFQKFGIDIDRATINTIRWSPLASMVWARLKYRLVRSAIPDTIEGRAHYWKKYYNSYLGAGTPEHYLKMAAKNGLS